MELKIRQENAGDHPGVAGLNNIAFGRPDEGVLVEKLRRLPRFLPQLSLVALTEGKLVGHILFFPVDIVENEGDRNFLSLSLAPMSVQPEYQNQGIGTNLVVYGLDVALTLGFTSVLVLGHPWYYPRFGFEPASRFGIRSPWEEVPDEAFMALELEPGSLKDVRGLVEYPDCFMNIP